MPTFVFNDERIINSYGFRVKNAGGNFNRFDGNPVMLNSHINKPENTLGNWKNRSMNGPLLTGDSNFDRDLDAALAIEGQVDRGFIKACSMGLSLSFDSDSWQQGPDGVPELIKWELMEVSICAVPSNSNSLALYNKANGEMISEDQAKLKVLNLSTVFGKQHITLSAGNSLNRNYIAANVKTPDDFAALSFDAQNDFYKNHRAAYLQLFDKHSVAVNDTLQNQLNFSNNRLNANTVGQAGNYSAVGVRSIDDFEKLSHANKLHFKQNNLQAYRALFSIAAN